MHHYLPYFNNCINGALVLLLVEATGRVIKSLYVLSSFNVYIYLHVSTHMRSVTISLNCTHIDTIILYLPNARFKIRKGGETISG